MNTGLRLVSEGSEAQREIKEELFDTEHSEDEDVTKPSVADASDPTHFSIAIVGVTAVAGIERVIDLPALHAMAGRMFSLPTKASRKPPAQSGPPDPSNPPAQSAPSDFKNSVQFNLRLPSIPRPVSGRLFKNGKITLSSVKTFCVSEVFDAIINEIKEAHVRAKTEGFSGADVISGWTDGSPITVVGANVRLSLQLQFQLPFAVNYKKMIRHVKSGSRFVDPRGSILIRLQRPHMFLILVYVSDFLISDVRPNLPCGAGFMFATDVPRYVHASLRNYSCFQIKDHSGMVASPSLCS